MNRSLELYVMYHKNKSFDMIHCYNILSNASKWSNTVTITNERAEGRAQTIASRTSASSSADPSFASSSGSFSDDIVEVDDSSAFGDDRPIGVKQAKNKGK